MIKCNSVLFLRFLFTRYFFHIYNYALISNHIKHLNILVIKNIIKILFDKDSNLTLIFWLFKNGCFLEIALLIINLNFNVF